MVCALARNFSAPHHGVTICAFETSGRKGACASTLNLKLGCHWCLNAFATVLYLSLLPAVAHPVSLNPMSVLDAKDVFNGCTC